MSGRFATSSALVVQATLVEYENRLKIDYRCRDGGSGEVLTKAHTIQVAVDAVTQEAQSRVSRRLVGEGEAGAMRIALTIIVLLMAFMPVGAMADGPELLKQGKSCAGPSCRSACCGIRCPAPQPGRLHAGAGGRAHLAGDAALRRDDADDG